MPRRGQTTVTFNTVYFDQIMKSAGVESVTREAAERALAIAKSTAPVDTGSYRDQLHLEMRESQYRRVIRVVGSDPKTMLIESKTGNLARALKASKQ
jgi:hypothetical protein